MALRSRACSERRLIAPQRDEEIERNEPWALFVPSASQRGRDAPSPKQSVGPPAEPVKITLGNAVYISQDGLDPVLRGKLIRLAAFANPAFRDAERLRLHVYKIPRVICRAFAGKYVLGLSATVVRKDGQHPIIHMQCGPVRHRIEAKAMVGFGWFRHAVEVRLTGFESTLDRTAEAKGPAYAKLISELVNDAHRNEVSAVEARYAALGLIEDFMRSAAGSRKLSAYRDSYHRDFILTVALDEQDKTPVSCTTRELASV